MTGYRTEQRKLLYAFLEQHPDEHFSAREIADGLSGHSISLSAVYRNLSTMADEGLISRSGKDGGREILYRFTGAEECRTALHLACTQCGKTFHMSTPAAQLMLEGIALEGFCLDRTKTILYGVCKKCGCESV